MQSENALLPFRRSAHPRDIRQVADVIRSIEQGTWRRDYPHHQDAVDPRIQVIWLTAVNGDSITIAWRPFETDAGPCAYIFHVGHPRAEDVDHYPG